MLNFISICKIQAQEKLSLKNNEASFEISIQDKKLIEETFSLNKSSTSFTNDVDFEITIQWSHWRAPEKKNNGENELNLTKEDFELIKSQSNENSLQLFFDGPSTIKLILTYSIGDQNNYLRRNIEVYDSVYGEHFLHKISARKGKINARVKDIDNFGGFGQPLAFEMDNGSAFIGLEYPTSTNNIFSGDNHTEIDCFRYFGKQIGKEPIASENVIIALFPDKAIKKHFMDYVSEIAVTPAKPYTLYNSWYDLRAADYPRPVPKEYIMNEENVFKIIDLIKENMIDKHSIKLDAFVLDDGWDVYESDWVLRKEQFPNGMKPIADKLKKTDTDLGIWFGPTGGYSARMKRIDWMKNNGYEAVSNEYRYNASYLCLAGPKYSELFKNRTVDFVENQDVRYFKWDGIQFSCSNPEHGHPVGIYSRRAVMESVIDKCEAVRKNHPDVYLNITSGTWLSPWWVKYASQIWMDGGDYGWADLPSYNKRDAAITYRDFVLYDDFKQKNLWFPISHLMTHGIIKGNLQMLGGESEPLDKFTDNALLYFARGVSMYELYISPTILNTEEWEAISKSLVWARENFEILSRTFMIGGNPTIGEPYGYVHFNEDKGIVAVRNPYVEKNQIKLKFDSKYGLAENAESLVFERIYPTQWISPDLIKAEDEVIIDLGAYETAVFNIYPLKDAKKPLIANMVFNQNKQAKNEIELTLLEKTGDVKILNPDFFKKFTIDNTSINLESPEIQIESTKKLIESAEFSKQAAMGKESVYKLQYSFTDEVREATIGFLIEPSDKSKHETIPAIKVFDGTTSLPICLNGTKIDESTKLPKGEKTWLTFPVESGSKELRVILTGEKWQGKFEIFFMAKQKQPGKSAKITSNNEILLGSQPPKPWMHDELGKVEKVITKSIIIE